MLPGFAPPFCLKREILALLLSQPITPGLSFALVFSAAGTYTLRLMFTLANNGGSEARND